MQVTSTIAYHKKLNDGSIYSDKTIILNTFKELEFGTKEDIAHHLYWSQEKVHKRISELVRDGYLEPTDYKKVSKDTGHLQMVWKLKGIITHIPA